MRQQAQGLLNRTTFQHGVLPIARELRQLIDAGRTKSQLFLRIESLKAPPCLSRRHIQEHMGSTIELDGLNKTGDTSCMKGGLRNKGEEVNMIKCIV